MSQVQHSSCDALPLELWQQVLQHLVHEEPGPGTDEGLLYSEHLASLIQVSTVSRRLAAAVQLLLRSRGCAPGDECSRLDSTFFLTWAPHLVDLRLSDNCYHSPGVHTFLQACTHLQKLQLSCASMLQAVQADHLMESCGSFDGQLILDCNHVPYIPMTALTALHVDFEADGMLAPGANQDQHTVLLYRLGHLRQLQRLHLQYCSGPIHLASKVILSMLSHISLTFTLDEDSEGPEYRLGWLRRQPCALLEIRIHLHTVSPATQQAMVHKLMRLPVARLALVIALPTPVVVQRLWTNLPVREYLQIEVEQGCCSADMRLQALPRSPVTRIWGFGGMPVHVDWAALTQRPGRFDISFDQRIQDLVIHGTCNLPTHLQQQQPWQLAVHAARQVRGLEQAQVLGSKLVMQNAAAREASWTADI